MNKLYMDYSNFYHEMYQHLFDYEEESKIYSQYLIENKCASTIEVGCGSGNISYELSKISEYIGVDISAGMIEIAKKNNPKLTFMQGDMRNIKLDNQTDSVLITGRTMSHMITNDDVFSTLKSVSNSLNENGLLVFDFFNANKLFTSFQSESEQSIENGESKYIVRNENTPNLETGWTWNWKAKYKMVKDGEEQSFEDFTTMRAFTKDEMKLFLEMTGFKLEEVRDRGIALIFVARKKGI